MAKKVKAGSAELRKVLRQFPVSVESVTGGGHGILIGPDGEPLRMPDGRKVTISSSPKCASMAAKAVVRQLRSLGVEPRA